MPDRMGPPHQCLCADDRARVEVELGLQVNAESSLDCGAEVAEHRETCRCAAIDLVAVHLDTEALRLGIEHRDVGVPERGALLVVAVDQGHLRLPSRRSSPIERHRSADVAYGFQREIHHVGMRRAMTDDGELVTGQSRQNVVGAEHRTQTFADLDE